MVRGGPVVDFPGLGGLRLRVRTLKIKQGEVVVDGFVTTDDTEEGAPLRKFAVPCLVEIMRAMGEVIRGR